MEGVLVDESEKENLRNELLEFLEDFRHKKNDEGNLIIQFPKNFDQISDAMTRQDLISTDDRTWSKYLLEEKFDQDSQRNFEGGRYSDLMKESHNEVMVNRGLASIHLLDKQIISLDKQARQFPGSSRGLSKKGKGKMHNLDSATFITGAMSVNGDDSNLNTARSTATVCSELSDHDSEAGISAGFGGLSNISPRSRLSASRDEGLQTTDEQENSASEEEVNHKNMELRLEAILNMGDENEDDEHGEHAKVWKSLSRYGYTEESQNRIQEIDRQLSTIQTQSVSLEPYLSKHLSSQSLVSSLSDEDVRVAMIDTSQSVVTSFPPVPGHTKASEEAHTTSADANSHIEKSKDASAKKEKQENVLQKQRVHRLMKEYEKKIDDLLHTVHTEELNISGLVSTSLKCPPPPPSSFLPSIGVPSSGELSKSAVLSKKTAIQSAEATIVGRHVTMEDIENVIEGLCYDQNNDISGEIGGIDSADRVPCQQGTLLSRDHGLHLDRLLTMIRPDVARLAAERLCRDQSSCSASDLPFHETERGAGHHRLSSIETTPSLQYQQDLQEYLNKFTEQYEEEEEGGMFSDVMSDSCTGESTYPHQEFQIETTRSDVIDHSPINTSSIAAQDVTDDFSTIRDDISETHETLSRMTTQQLKVAKNKKGIPQIMNNDNSRLQNIIYDIMAKKSCPVENMCADEIELGINLEHAHGKIQAILNRVKDISRGDGSEDML